MFSDELEKISWEETTARINAKTEADVRRALSKAHCDVDDFMALVSPAAAPYLETMARLSRKYTEERFGKTMSMFIPLYITNSCTNSCVYCAFREPLDRDGRESGQGGRALSGACLGFGQTLLQ